MFTYRKILRKAWDVTWQNPILWFFGLFVALLGVGGELEILFGSVALGDTQALIPSLLAGFAEGGIFSSTGIFGITSTILSRPLPFLSLLLWLGTILLLTVIVVWLVIVSQGALINGVVSIVKNKQQSWATYFESGLKTFWPVLVLNIVARLIFGLLFLVLSYLAVLSFPGAAAFFVGAFIIFVGVIVVVSFIIKYAVCDAVLNNRSPGDAIAAAVTLFRRNWLLSLEVATVLFFIYWLVTILLINLLSSFFISALRVFGPEGSVALVSFLLVLLVVICAQILLAIFHWSAWVLVFEVITSKRAVLSSRLNEWFQKIVQK